MQTRWTIGQWTPVAMIWHCSLVELTAVVVAAAASVVAVVWLPDHQLDCSYSFDAGDSDSTIWTLVSSGQSSPPWTQCPSSVIALVVSVQISHAPPLSTVVYTYTHIHIQGVHNVQLSG